MPFSTTEIVIIVLVIILLFGATSIPKLARALGRAQGEFNKAKGEFHGAAKRTEADATGIPATSEDDIRRTARSLGIVEAGLSLDEVKRLIQQKLA